MGQYVEGLDEDSRAVSINRDTKGGEEAGRRRREDRSEQMVFILAY